MEAGEEVRFLFSICFRVIDREDRRSAGDGERGDSVAAIKGVGKKGAQQGKSEREKKAPAEVAPREKERKGGK